MEMIWGLENSKANKEMREVVQTPVWSDGVPENIVDCKKCRLRIMIAHLQLSFE